MNKIKLIFIDIDGTLGYRINNTTYIPPENCKAIQKAREQGIQIILTTGRPYHTTLPVFKQIGQVNDYLIVMGGGTIIKNDEIIDEIYLSEESTQTIKRFIKENNLYCQFYKGNKYFINEKTKETEKYETTCQFSPTIIGEDIFALEKVQRITVVAENDEMKQKIITTFSQNENIILNIFWDNWIELSSKETSKGNAVKKICKQLGIDLKNVMAIGDDVNDESMLDIVGYPVVMENAKDNLKREGRYITDSCKNGGVSKVIEKFCFY